MTSTLAPPPADRLTPYPVSFPGITIAGNRDLLLLRRPQPCAWLASTVIGGGYGRRDTVLALRVARQFNCNDPRRLLRAAGRGHGGGRPFVGFLTAIDLRRAAIVEDPEMGVLVVATAGAGNASAPGRSRVATPVPGTINITVLVHGRLGPAALAGAAIVVTEAKTLALVEAGIRLTDGGVATGTSTDALAVGCDGAGDRYLYTGPVTPIGATVGRLVTEAVGMSLNGGNVARFE